MEEKGTISIHTENIFPIIKKFLYADHEIFLRELVSNAVDASQKIKRLSDLGEFNGEVGELKVTVSVDTENKTITISDRGIGMTADDIKKYINQIAFSGATEFIEQYKDKTDTSQIIGNFGLGFYSAFMVSKNVEINTLSYKEGSQAAHWTCDGSTEFTIDASSKTERGTDIILHLADDSFEFADNYRLQSILNKYCRFLPIEIEFDGKVINDTAPLWTKSPSELSDEDYITFYKKLYPMSEDPLFWIHLNVDYPFNLTGVLYFPKLKKDFEFQRNKIQLYSRQVFITDEVKDVVPEFLMLLHGVLDSPDIPLNVSRSFLQADGNVKKINSHITKKVADKLQEIYNQNPESFQEKWDDISLFVKYGMISDEKFYDKAKNFCLLKSTNGEYATIENYRNKVSATQTDKNGSTVFLYTSNASEQDSYIQSARKRGYDVLVLDSAIDSHFINQLESKLEKTSMKRVDSDSIEKLIEKDEVRESVLSTEDKEKVTAIFTKASEGKGLRVATEVLPVDEMPVTITVPEFMRRMKDMSATGGGGMFGNFMKEEFVAIINENHPLLQKLLKLSEQEQQVLAGQTLDIALLSQGLLKGESLTKFIERSISLLNQN
ncbi:MAG TPA: molecular chaperone HtpG [Cytophagaceae bacterium]|jgi:molecular chaperone HtpG|nr:molecular chaperone HtpG [Cytophagaceae bacterium]